MNRHLLSLALLLSLLATPLVAAEPSSPAARTIVLVRHGQYLPDPSAAAKLGPHLSPLGVAQAHLAGARLSAMGVPFDALYASPLQRAKDTAAIIATDFPGRTFKVIDALEECTPPTRRSEVMADGKPEEFAACKDQLDQLFAEHFKPAQGADRTEMFVCHGNVIRYLVTRALGVDTAAWLEMSVGHASITRIRVEADGRYKVIAVGEVGHLPSTLLTGASGDSERGLAIPALPVP